MKTALVALTAIVLMPFTAVATSAADEGGNERARAERAASPQLKVKKAAPVAGSWIRFTGSAPKAWRGKRVTVQHRQVKKDAPWAADGRTLIRDDGAIRFKRRAAGTGPQEYRLSKSSSSFSKAVRVSVHQWYYLADRNYIAVERGTNCTGGCTGFHSDGVRIGGVQYPKSWIMKLNDDGDASITTWNASRKCRTLDMTVGLADYSETSTARFSVDVGGGPVQVASLPVGTGQRVKYDMRGIFRFSVAVVQTSGGEDVYSALGDARLLCSGRP